MYLGVLELLIPTQIYSLLAANFFHHCLHLILSHLQKD
jgi:hypothetical protein